MTGDVLTLLFVTVQWLVIVYFVVLHAAYLGLDAVSLIAIRGHARLRELDASTQRFSGLEPPVSVLVPARDEAATIESSVRALLQLAYPEYEVVVVDDGSTDGTLDALAEAFDLEAFPQAYRVQVPCAQVRQVYVSRQDPRLRVVAKAGGGKADALNAGLNLARYPLVAAVDADSVLQRDSLARLVRPLADDPRTVAAGGTVRILNGCRVSGGFLDHVDVPSGWLARIQVVEYLRAFLFGRLGWAPLNAVLVISGAFGMFRRAAVVEVGGWRTGTVGEDMDLVVRLQETLRRDGRPFRITFIPEPVCWTEAPGDLRGLARQRIRWQRGLLESLAAGRRLPRSRRGGAAGWVAYPFHLLLEGLGPIVEVLGLVALVAGALLGFVSGEALVAFLLLAVSLGLVLSVSAVLLEEISFRVYPRPRALGVLLAAAVVENFGYRQAVAVWRLIGLARFALGSGRGWSSPTRVAGWAQAPAEASGSSQAAGLR